MCMHMPYHRATLVYDLQGQMWVSVRSSRMMISTLQPWLEKPVVPPDSLYQAVMQNSFFRSADVSGMQSPAVHIFIGWIPVFILRERYAMHRLYAG